MFTPAKQTGRLFRRYLRAAKHPAKIRIQNLLGKNAFRGGITVANEEGILFILDANDWITRTMLLEGNYEKDSLLLATNILSNGGIFIDVGANFGLYTCMLSANKAVEAIAVEPNYMVLPRLLKNIRLNKRSNVTVLNAALGGRFDFLSFEARQENNLGAASFAPNKNFLLGVLGCGLEFVFEARGLKDAELIKLDIEGNEWDVLKSFPFEKYRVKNILLEYNNLASFSLNDLKMFFSERGFVLKNIYGKAVEENAAALPENNLWLVNTNTVFG